MPQRGLISDVQQLNKNSGETESLNQMRLVRRSRDLTSDEPNYLNNLFIEKNLLPLLTKVLKSETRYQMREMSGPVFIIKTEQTVALV